ncbi:flap endonuclease, partial [Nocardioides hankookensis]
AAADYLAVAPQVVAVARDIDLGSPATRLPAEPVDLQRVAELGTTWGLESPVQRLTEVLLASS